MRRPYTLGRCDCCGGHRLLKYAKRTHCCRYRCQKAAAALLAAANEDAEDDLAPTFAKSIEFILGQRFCDPAELNDEKRRNILSSSDFKRCYLIDGIFATRPSDDGFRDKRWVEIDELVEKISEPDLDTALEKWMTTVAADTKEEMARLRNTARERKLQRRSIVADQRSWRRCYGTISPLSTSPHNSFLRRRGKFSRPATGAQGFSELSPVSP